MSGQRPEIFKKSTGREREIFKNIRAGIAIFSKMFGSGRENFKKGVPALLS
jgi:hypothetical protein